LSNPEELNRNHDVSGFGCGRESLDDWLKNWALKSNAAGDSRVFVVCDDALEVVVTMPLAKSSATRLIRFQWPLSGDWQFEMICRDTGSVQRFYVTPFCVFRKRANTSV
jgi:hypothetical protein